MLKQLKKLISELIKYLQNKNDQMESVWININDLPIQFGETLEERLETFKKYREMGIIVINKTKCDV